MYAQSARKDHIDQVDNAAERPQGIGMFPVAMGVIQPVGHVVDYHSYWIDDGAGSKVVNPQFNADCRHLLNLKNVAERGHPSAIAYFSKVAAQFLLAHGVPPVNLQVHIVVVPSSTSGRWSPGLLKIGENLVRNNKNFVDSMQSLVRTTTIQKLARGGDRSLLTHQRSIDLNDPTSKLSRKTILLLDDITTTGNSLVACAGILQLGGAATIMPLALGKTV